MLGIAAGDWLSLPLGAALGMAGRASLGRGLARLRQAFLGLAMLGLAVAAGLVGQAVRARPPPGLLLDGKQTVDATVVTAPERVFGVTRLTVELDAVAHDGVQRAARGRVVVSVG